MACLCRLHLVEYVADHTTLEGIQISRVLGPSYHVLCFDYRLLYLEEGARELLCEVRRMLHVKAQVTGGCRRRYHRRLIFTRLRRAVYLCIRLLPLTGAISLGRLRLSPPNNYFDPATAPREADIETSPGTPPDARSRPAGSWRHRRQAFYIAKEATECHTAEAIAPRPSETPYRSIATRRDLWSEVKRFARPGRGWT